MKENMMTAAKKKGHEINDSERKWGFVEDCDVFRGVSPKQVFDCVEFHKADGTVKTYTEHRVSSRPDAKHRDGKFRIHEDNPNRMDGLSEVYNDLALGVEEIDVRIRHDNENGEEKTVFEIHENYDEEAKARAAAYIRAVVSA